MVLPPDLLLVPVKDLPENVRRQIQAEDGDYALTRPQSRTPSRVVDAEAAALLNEFRKPTTIVDAIIRYSQATKADPQRMLEDAFPMLERLAHLRMLVPPDSDEAHQVPPALESGASLAGCEVIRCVQSLEDTELYHVRTSQGENAALKILRANATGEVARMLDREAGILARLDGRVSPRVLAGGTDEGRRYLLIEWCSGVDCATVAADLRLSSGPDARARLLSLCRAILDAYAELHASNVIHSDIHPRNVLVNEVDPVKGTYSIKIIDFGLGRVPGIDNEFRRVNRGGVAFFFEPEYAKTALAKKQPPYSSALGEQYALAALIYQLITGNHYLDFSLEKREMLRQIVEDAPLAFSLRGCEAWPELEQVLAKALSKHTSDRFTSVAEFAECFKAVTVPDLPSVPSNEDAAAPATFPDAQAMLRSMLARLEAAEPLFASGLKAAPKVSITYGSAGVAYGLYRIACARQDARLLALADLWASRSARDAGLADAFYNPEIEITPEIVGRVSPYHTPSGVYLVQGLIGRAMADMVSQQTAVDNFVNAVNSAPCDNLDITLGRAGTLLGAAFLLDAVSGDTLIESGALVECGNQTFSGIWDQILSYPAIRECREISYSGAAHGWAGILYGIMCWCQSSGAPLPAGFEERVDQLAALTEHVGRRARWKWSVRRRRGEQGSPYMPGWCNGSAGFVFLWTLAHRMLGKPEYLTLAEKAGFDAWESENQIGNLCCGFAGQAYALLNLYKHTEDKAWLHRAQSLAQRAARSTIEMPAGTAYQELLTRAESLYKGELGVAVLAAELENPLLAAMPFFEREV
jgi:serine/threonine-protein kinase